MHLCVKKCMYNIFIYWVCLYLFEFTLSFYRVHQNGNINKYLKKKSWKMYCVQRCWTNFDFFVGWEVCDILLSYLRECIFISILKMRSASPKVYIIETTDLRIFFFLLFYFKIWIRHCVYLHFLIRLNQSSKYLVPN